MYINPEGPRDLSLSTRTLQRRLGELGSSCQQVLDHVRHRTALRLLRAKELGISEIAFLLGFEELNSFTRAFRWSHAYAVIQSVPSGPRLWNGRSALDEH